MTTHFSRQISIRSTGWLSNRENVRFWNSLPSETVASTARPIHKPNKPGSARGPLKLKRDPDNNQGSTAADITKHHGRNRARPSLIIRVVDAFIPTSYDFKIATKISSSVND